MPLQATSGAASYDAFGGGVAVEPNYIESVFSCFLYTGNGSTQTITNGIDLAGKGGLVWIKDRVGTYSHNLVDSARGTNNYLFSDLTSAQFDAGSLRVSSFNADGFSLGSGSNGTNRSGNTHVSWTFRKQPKFFDVVTYTGTGVASRAISHNLGSAPGMMIVKQTDGTRNWPVYHRSVPTGTGYLNQTGAFVTGSGNGVWGDSSYNNIAPTSTVFYVGSDSEVNGNGLTYVAYLFAHDAGGFGLTGTDNVISCGSYSHTNGSNTSVTLGFEPQFCINRFTGVGIWVLMDSARGMPALGGGNGRQLQPQSSDAEEASGTIKPTATGFIVDSSLETGTYIYIAIRRGPMKVPSTGTSVFAPVAYTGNGTAGRSITAGFPVDLAIGLQRTPANGSDRFFVNRLVGATKGLVSWDTFAEATDANSLTAFDSMTSVTVGTDTTDRGFNGSGRSLSPYFFRRSPSVFDIVCYTGTGSATTFSHNLQAVPELMIVKKRSATDDWAVYAGDNTDFLLLNTTAATADDNTYWNDTSPTSTVFSVGTNADVNTSAATYVAYLFATCPGVSKVGSYTGDGTDGRIIDCGFTSGARFVLIKSTSNTGNWWVWDTARGIVSGNDPVLRLNTTAAESTNSDDLDPSSSGFIVNYNGLFAINESGWSYIFLAIA